MPIKKRLTPAERLHARTDGTFNRMVAFPLISAMVQPNYASHVDVSAESIAKIVSSFYEKDWMTRVGWNEKIFVYTYGMVARRADVPGLLDDERMTQLARHMNAQSTIDKIDKNEVQVGLAFRMTLVFDLPDLIKKYKGPGSITLPSFDSKPKVRKKLAKHKR